MVTRNTSILAPSRTHFAGVFHQDKVADSEGKTSGYVPCAVNRKRILMKGLTEAKVI